MRYGRQHVADRQARSFAKTSWSLPSRSHCGHVAGLTMPPPLPVACAWVGSSGMLSPSPGALSASCRSRRRPSLGISSCSGTCWCVMRQDDFKLFKQGNSGDTPTAGRPGLPWATPGSGVTGASVSISRHRRQLAELWRTGSVWLASVSIMPSSPPWSSTVTLCSARHIRICKNTTSSQLETDAPCTGASRPTAHRKGNYP